MKNTTQNSTTPNLKSTVLADVLSFDGAVEKGMTWQDVIRHWNPNLSNEEVIDIYVKMKELARIDSVEGRRKGFTEQMIFDRIKFTHFAHLNIS